MKKTAVDWLIQELVNQKLVKIDKLSTYYWYKNFATTFELLCENARRMEKQQIIDSYGPSKVYYDDEFNQMDEISGEQYYQETYKQD